MNIIKKWQEARQKAKKEKAQNAAWLELSNLYLDIEAGRELLNRRRYCELDTLLSRAYDRDDAMRGWWWQEFSKLPNWLNV